MQAKSEDTESGAIGVRPPKYMRAALRKLAADLDYSEGQLLYRSAEAIIAMVEAPEPIIPRLVAVARQLRKSGVTFASEERQFPIHLTLVEPPSLRVDESGLGYRVERKKTSKRGRSRGVPAKA